MFLEFGMKNLGDVFGAPNSEFYGTWKRVRASPVIPRSRYLETWTEGINWFSDAEVTSH